MTEMVIKKTDLYIIKENNRRNQKIKTTEIRKKTSLQRVTGGGIQKGREALRIKKEKERKKDMKNWRKAVAMGLAYDDWQHLPVGAEGIQYEGP